MHVKFDGVGLSVNNAAIKITPQWAKEILDLQQAKGWINRKLYPGKVTEYKEAMLAGEFRPNTMIQLSSEKRLLDAWHRLTACVAANVPFYAIVITDIPEEAHDKIDIGSKRTIAHKLTFEGKVSAQKAAATVTAINTLNMYIQQTPGRKGVAAGPALAQTNGVDLVRARALLEQHPRIVDSIEYIGTKSQVMSAAILHTVHYLIAHVAGKKHEADNFVDLIKSGAYLPPSSPILALRRLVIEKSPMAATDFGTRLWITIEAANCYLAGHNVSKGLFSKKTIESIGPSALIGAAPTDVARMKSTIRAKKSRELEAA